MKCQKQKEMLKTLKIPNVPFVTILSDGVLSYINEGIVWHQWSNVETRPSWLSARLDHRQSRQSSPGRQTRLDHTVSGSVPSCSEPQLLHQRSFLWRERRASPRRGQRSVDQLAHFFPGSGRSFGLSRLPASGCVLGTPCQFVHRVDSCQLIRANNWKTTTDVSAETFSYVTCVKWTDCCRLYLCVIIITLIISFIYL